MSQIHITCPACQYRFDLLSGLQDLDQRSYWNEFIKSKLTTDQISLVFRYLVMFKPAKNAMSFKAMSARTRELLELSKSGRVTKGGDVRVAPPAMWYAAIEKLVTDKPESLQTPLKNHSYLTTIVFNHAEAAAAKAESAMIIKAKTRVRTPEQEAGLVTQIDTAVEEVGQENMSQIRKILPKHKR